MTGVVYYMNIPLAVDTVIINPKTAELSFSEQGIVLALRRIDVFSTVSGEITELNFDEGQQVSEGDVICKVNDTSYKLEISQIESGIKGYEAQIANLSTEERKQRDSLTLNRDNLLGELNTLSAQESGVNISLDEQIRLQGIIIKQCEDDLKRAQENVVKLESLKKIIIEQNKNDLEKAKENVENVKQRNSFIINQNSVDLEKAKENLERSEVLYNANVITKYEYDEAVRAVQDAQTLLEKNQTITGQEYDAAVRAVSDAETLLAQNEEIAKQDSDEALSAVQKAETALEQNNQQLQVIKSGTSGGLNSDEYFEAVKQSLITQIRGIEDSMNKSYTQDTTDYYVQLIEGNRANIALLNQQIEKTVIKASASGTISKLNIKDTNVVNAQTPIAVITAEKDCIVETYVAVKNINSIELGKSVLLTLEDRILDKEITGKVTSIENNAEVRISALGVEERKVKVTITPDETDELKDGYDVDVKFNYYYEEDKLTVPKTALFKDNDIDMVWIVQEGVVQKKQVQKGIELRTEFVIDSGLTQGDMVIVDCNIQGLKEGVKISVV